MPHISVLITTYNREKFLPATLDSLKRQTFQDYELILVNNGSTDGTADICREYAKQDRRVKLIHIDKNTGASPGRNIGLEHAVGEYITFIDDDDRFEPNMLAFLAELALETGADISMCGSYNEFADRLEPYFICDNKFVFDRLQGLRELLNRNLYNVAPPTKLFKRSLWDGFVFPENVLVDDIHVIYKIFEGAKSVAVWNKPLYFFRKHESNMTGFIHNRQMTPELLDEYIDMYQTRAEYLTARAPEISDDIEKSKILFMKSMCKNIQEGNLQNCKKQLRFMTKYEKCIIITIAYNAEKTLAQTINSILNQTHKNWVYYVINNGSTDDTEAIVQKYASETPNIIALRNKENMVFEKGNNWKEILMKHNSTDWVCFLDADDEYKPDFLEEMLIFSVENNLDVAACGHDFVNAKTNQVMSVRILENNLILESRDSFGHHFPVYHQFMRTIWCKLYKSELLTKYDMENLAKVYYGGDTAFTMEAFKNASRGGVLAKTLHKYYVSENSASYLYLPERLYSDRIMDDITRKFVIDKCGEISLSNENFLNRIYFNAIKDTLSLMSKSRSQIPLDNMISDLHEVLVNENANRLLAWESLKNEKIQLFKPLLKWINSQKKNHLKKYWKDNCTLVELEITINYAIRDSDAEIFNFLTEINETSPVSYVKLDIDNKIYKLMEKYPLLKGLNAKTAVFLHNAVCTVMQNKHPEITALSKSNIPDEHMEAYLKFSQNVCASAEYIEGWIYFRKLWIKFLLDNNKTKEARSIINEMIQVLPNDNEIAEFNEYVTTKA